MVLITAEGQRGITKTSFQAEPPEKTSAIQRQLIQGPLVVQSSFCRVTAKLLLSIFAETQRITTQKRALPPLSLYCLISSGNFPLQLVPGDYHLALKP